MTKFLDSLGLARVRDWVKTNFALKTQIPTKTSDLTNDSGFITGSAVAAVTGVKGNAESSYRTGNVNLTPANIGAAEASHSHSGYAASNHTHAASSVNSGTFDAARIPNLAASKITSGTFDAARLPTSGITAGSYGPSANQSPAYGGGFSVPYITFDNKGRATAASTKTVYIPNRVNFSCTLLWTNSSPTSSFAPQYVYLNTGYNAFLIIARWDTDYSHGSGSFVIPNLNGDYYLLSMGARSNTNNSARLMGINSGNFYFYEGKNSSSGTKNDHCIPLKILGLSVG